MSMLVLQAVWRKRVVTLSSSRRRSEYLRRGEDDRHADRHRRHHRAREHGDAHASMSHRDHGEGHDGAGTQSRKSGGGCGQHERRQHDADAQ